MDEIVKKDFVLKKNTEIDGNLRVVGDIICEQNNQYELKVSGDIAARNISVGNIFAKCISAQDISARDITILARDIIAGDILVDNISARDISAWNITARYIEARNIKYFAVCYAYYSIQCKSIDGWRPNSRHFVLDGKIKFLK